MISRKAIINKNVELGNGCTVEDHVILGAPVKGDDPYPVTAIGDGSMIRSHTVIYSGNRIGRNFQTGNKANIRETNDIGDDVSIGTLSVVEHHVTIGNRVRVHSQVFIPEFSVLEDGCWLGPGVVLTNARFPNTAYTKEELKGPRIRSGARIGANSTVLPGVTVGQLALVGAGSVVTRDVLEREVVAGNPARRLGWSCTCGVPLEGDGKALVCRKCGARFDEGEPPNRLEVG
ncbi:MAG: transferase [Candidatus Thermoplasmatota archaeon]|nr:transferase [Candidatus Thermoplasmatota archaeon]